MANDRSDRPARRKLRRQILTDADRLLELTWQTQDGLPADSSERPTRVYAVEFPGQLVLQDVKRVGDGDDYGGMSLKDGVSKDRRCRHLTYRCATAHKRCWDMFGGQKVAVVLDSDTRLIATVEALPGNAADSTGALSLVEQNEASTAEQVVETMGDTAYYDSGIRQDYADAGSTVVAAVPHPPSGNHFPNEDFVIDLATGRCTCPAGQATRRMVPMAMLTEFTGRTYKLEGSRFDGVVVCGACPLRSQCSAARACLSRTVRPHSLEALPQEAR